MKDIQTIKRLRAAKKRVITIITTNLIESIAHVAAPHDNLGKKTTIEKALAEEDAQSHELYNMYDDELEVLEVTSDMQYVNKVNSQLVKLDSALVNSATFAAPSKTKPKGIKLPILTLPVFDEDPTQWAGFWELFLCSINYQQDLTPLQKFT